jgi:drug/metabolite transporter (DMT)-like permease
VISAPAALALVAAVAFAAGNNLQRTAAAKVPTDGYGPIRLILRLLRSPRWLAGGACAVVGLLCQVSALGRGGVILVQAVIASTLVFSLAMEALAERRRPDAGPLIGSVTVVGGIVLLVRVGQPGAGGEFTSLWRALPAWIAVGLAGGGSLLLARRRPKGRTTAIVLGAAAGTCFALDAVFLRGLADAFSPWDTVTVVTNAAGFAVASVLGNLSIQRGFHLAPLRHVLPAMAATEPLAAFACGRLLFGERLQPGPVGVLAVVGGLALMTAGVVLCATRTGAATSRGRRRFRRSVPRLRPPWSPRRSRRSRRSWRAAGRPRPRRSSPWCHPRRRAWSPR